MTPYARRRIATLIETTRDDFHRAIADFPQVAAAIRNITISQYSSEYIVVEMLIYAGGRAHKLRYFPSTPSYPLPASWVTFLAISAGHREWKPLRGFSGNDVLGAICYLLALE